MNELLTLLDGWKTQIIEDIQTIVELESPSGDVAALQTVADFIRMRCVEAGASVDILKNPNPDLADHLLATWKTDTKNARPPGACKRILLLGHFDTVHAKGTFQKPFRTDGDYAYGPGIFDMKTGIVMAIYAWKAIQALQLPMQAEIVGVFTTDEETGSATSRGYIEDIARTCEAVLVLEPSAGGKVKTSRKGVGNYQVCTYGQAAHAGLDHQNGKNAIVELAHHMIHLQNLTDYEKGTTISVGIVEGGTRSNVVPDFAKAIIDVRAVSMAEAQRIDEEVRQMTPVIPGAKIEVSGGINRPPLERTDDVARLFELARTAGQELGMQIEEIGVGGGSDGNFTAALGIPTLDGLGAVGDGAHTLHEHIRLSALPERIALLVKLLQKISE
ncbi:M20 family metallopeptidase [Fodinisporobacter ferrooxydans]|uniref:M20 family metallopeptidase n=1 Tax=Fodinisporobacter ferrooxydans TaxID=2901836 RepID=A0ABY4CM21_9BACL|nr:M20 family metallopeptidase [Alicyclobacillaceae bacterium MYW30-H2]